MWSFAKEGPHIARVLVVEDDPEVLMHLVRTLGTHYPVLSATYGEEALRIARAARPTLIVLDVMMPGGMDGFTVFAELRRDPSTQRIPIIFLSSVNQTSGLAFDSEVLNRHLGSKPAAFLDKPVCSDKLLSEIRKALGEESRACGTREAPRAVLRG